MLPGPDHSVLLSHSSALLEPELMTFATLALIPKDPLL